MNYMQRSRPKGYAKKVWESCWREAEENKAWAIENLTEDTSWLAKASTASQKMLCEYYIEIFLRCAKIVTTTYI